MIAINRHRARRVANDAELAAMRARFESDTFVRLTGFFEPSFLDELRALLAQTPFHRHAHAGIGVDESADPGRLMGLLLLVLNDPELFAFVSELTGCGAIGVFEGRVYRMLPASDHVDSWHSDAIRNRLVAISINLGREAVPMAPLQIRRRESDQILHEVVNFTPGDAVLFRVDPDYVHRIKPLADAGPRVACAGWFCAGPDLRQRFTDALRELVI